MQHIRILSAKKLQPNQRQYLLNAGFAVTEADFIGIKYKEFAARDIADNLIFTSQNAVKAVAEKYGLNLLAGKKLFCVGGKTRAMLEGAGGRVEAAADYAEALAAIITEKYRHETFTFFSGNLRRDTLPEMLKEAGVALNETEVYETIVTPHKINAVPDGILFFSPSGVEGFLKENTIGNAVCFCIGTTTAQALEGVAGNIVIANKPSVENVIIQCINYYK
ncbi:uroporphyrinogen-III synthase [Flavobacterium coralii]|uniref:uroporphyrinogen-III synthase n=1 Tax=Flavobacterium coralii TaxID=2838017 RepID=UPI000C3EBCF9|nr:uroporphyrinogen III synthase [Flavobacterium sp.]|tara:strand:- start:67566 stop:68228 length:663 start_codon:yes stop_codon:yes gene_type:complete